MATSEKINSLEAEKLGLESYLNSTDWQAIRLAETGVKMADGIAEGRANARVRISSLREELNVLYAQLVAERESESHEPIELTE